MKPALSAGSRRERRTEVGADGDPDGRAERSNATKAKLTTVTTSVKRPMTLRSASKALLREAARRERPSSRAVTTHAQAQARRLSRALGQGLVKSSGRTLAPQTSRSSRSPSDTHAANHGLKRRGRAVLRGSAKLEAELDFRTQRCERPGKCRLAPPIRVAAREVMYTCLLHAPKGRTTSPRSARAARVTEHRIDLSIQVRVRQRRSGHVVLARRCSSRRRRRLHIYPLAKPARRWTAHRPL